MVLIWGWMGGRGVGGGGGEWASWRRAYPAIRPQTVVLCSQQKISMYTNHRINRDGHWQQSGTQPILISALQGPNKTCNAPARLHRVGKKSSVKADLAIYSHAFDASRQCMSESLIFGLNLDFSSCNILVGFVNPATICKETRIVKHL